VSGGDLAPSREAIYFDMLLRRTKEVYKNQNPRILNMEKTKSRNLPKAPKEDLWRLKTLSK
jgi:hypothetical protein